MTERKTAGSVVGMVNRHVFAELDRLAALDGAERESLESEIARAKAVKDLCDTAIGNMNAAIRVVSTANDMGMAVSMPKGLLDA